jgi:K+ transporter
VLSAVGGIALTNSTPMEECNISLFTNCSTSTFTPLLAPNVTVVVTIAILVLLFLCQPFGTAKIGLVFGPIMLLYFLAIAVIGLLSFFHDISTAGRVATAFNPIVGISYLIRTGAVGYIQLGAVFLCTTGVEAMYSDLGHFTAWSIRFSWMTVVFPSVIFSYLGQTAALVRNPEIYVSPFFIIIPTPIYWSMIVLVAFATIIASQAMITANFSVAAQASGYGYFPPLTVVQTSKVKRGQIYVPLINYALLFLTCALVYAFYTSAALTGAYGVTIIIMICLTTFLYSLVLYYYHKFWLIVSLLFFVTISVDLVFLGSLVIKIPAGGWVPLALSAFVIGVTYCWIWGQKLLKTGLDSIFSTSTSNIHNFSDNILPYFMRKLQEPATDVDGLPLLPIVKSREKKEPEAPQTPKAESRSRSPARIGDEPTEQQENGEPDRDEERIAGEVAVGEAIPGDVNEEQLKRSEQAHGRKSHSTTAKKSKKERKREKKANMIVSINASTSPSTYSTSDDSILSENFISRISLFRPLDVVEVDICGFVAKVNRTIGAAVFIGDSNVNIPFVFELFASRAHALPELVIFIQVVRNFEVGDLKEHFRVNLATKNLIQFDIMFGFQNKDILLLEVLQDAFSSIAVDFPQDISVYHCQHSIKVKETTPFYFWPPLLIYKYMKDIFPEPMPIEVSSDILTILVHTQELDGK